MQRVIVGSAVLLWWIATTAMADGHRPSNPQEVKLIASLQGPALYQAYCATCHGTDARGGGPMAESLKVAPADLTRIAARNAGVFPLARVSNIISGEEHLPRGHGNRTMPVWGPIFSRVESDRDLGR